jgi:hypothetical protein
MGRSLAKTRLAPSRSPSLPFILIKGPHVPTRIVVGISDKRLKVLHPRIPNAEQNRADAQARISSPKLLTHGCSFVALPRGDCLSRSTRSFASVSARFAFRRPSPRFLAVQPWFSLKPARTAPTSRSASPLKRSWLTLSALRRANGFKSSGSSPDCGIEAPSTSTGITRMSRLSAVPISTRTKSSGLSSRRLPCSSDVTTQCRPIIAISTSQDATLSSIAFTKSVPRSMLSMSKKIWVGESALRAGHIGVPQQTRRLPNDN